MDLRHLLVDTSAYSLAERAHPEVVDVLRRADNIYVTPVILGELLAGFDQGGKARQNRRRLGLFLASPRVQVLTVQQETAEFYSQILGYLRTQGTPVPTNDVWIAASAMEHGVRVLTSDGHFGLMPQVLVHRVSVS